MKVWLNIEYSNKMVTAHGGMSLIKRFVDKTVIIDYISTPGLSRLGSNGTSTTVHICSPYHSSQPGS
jgi:hypothetical protein